MWISGLDTLAETNKALSVVLLAMIALYQPSNTSKIRLTFGGLLLLRFIWVYLVFSFLIVFSTSSELIVYLQQEWLRQEMLIHKRLIGIVVNTNQKTELSILMMVSALNISFSKKTCSGLQKQNGAESRVIGIKALLLSRSLLKSQGFCAMVNVQ